jgi:hypothetical protein
VTHFICKQCGVQFAAGEKEPETCPICEDERQFVNWEGQQWLTMETLRKQHVNLVRPEGPKVYGIGTEPKFAIGQRALLLQARGGNILWDCISLIDPETVRKVRELGGISAIAISHPHYYASSVDWSREFGGVPIFLHKADREWVMRPDPVIRFWEGRTYEIREGLTLINFGGHFEGGSLLHWAEGEDRRGALFTGDIIQVVPDRRFVSFMYSYPNYIPLDGRTVVKGLKAIDPFPFDAIYGAWWGYVIHSGAKQAVDRSVARYLCALEKGKTVCDFYPLYEKFSRDPE